MSFGHDEGLLIALGIAWLASPLALAVVVAIQAGRRRVLESQVGALARRLETLERQVGRGPIPVAAPTVAAPPSPVAPPATPAILPVPVPAPASGPLAAPPPALPL
jgi:hypothetical protein